MEVIRSGLIESDEQLMALAQNHGQVGLPKEDDLELTHWWVIRDDGVEPLYVGSDETFSSYCAEQNGGLEPQLPIR